VAGAVWGLVEVLQVLVKWLGLSGAGGGVTGVGEVARAV
jgi:hypothetical protein